MALGVARGCPISVHGGILIATLFLIGNIITDNEASESTETATTLRLPKSIVPESYDIKLMPFLWENNFTFNGEVIILVNVTKKTRKIILHAIDLEIDHSATAVKEVDPHGTVIKHLAIVNQKSDTARQFYIIRTCPPLVANRQYVIYLKFVGYLSDKRKGFYRLSYIADNKKRWIALTHFSPTGARSAFPCFDEPAFKATFDISIARPTNMTSLSNMPQRGESRPTQVTPEYTWDHYERTVRVSTYLVAFVIFDFEVLRSTNNFNVWSRHDVTDESRYVLDIGLKALKFYENYFQIKFALPKMDIVLIPGFEEQAMENWGLIIGDESLLLHQENISMSEKRENVARIVTHELVHQWFGNLVTEIWWNDVFLSEAFASYLAYVGMNSLEPKWKVFEQLFILHLQAAITTDLMYWDHPISMDVKSPDEIVGLFDTILYEKGAAVVWMMHHFLTNRVFKEGLTNYLTANAYQAVEADDLWKVLTQQAHEHEVLPTDITVKQIMDSWILQGGFPVVTVVRNYSSGGALISQEHFAIESIKSTDRRMNTLWWVPLTYTTEAAKDFNRTHPSYWMKAEKSITIPDLGASVDQWVIFNVQRTGYYCVNYDEQNWQMIAQQLHSNHKDIPILNRFQLVGDALNLAQAGRLSYSVALDVTSYLVHETEVGPWQSALTAMGYVDLMLMKYQNFDRLRVYVRNLLNNIYHKVGFEDHPGDSKMIVGFRTKLLRWACQFGHVDCVRNAKAQFQNWTNMSDPDKDNPIPLNLRTTVYRTVVETGGKPVWDFLMRRFLKANNSDEIANLFRALSYSRKPELLKAYLKLITTEMPVDKRQYVSDIFDAIAKNPLGQPLVINFLRNHWKELEKYMEKSGDSVNWILSYVVADVTTEKELQGYLDIIERYQGKARREKVEKSSSVVNTARANIQWVNHNVATIKDWLESNAN